MLRIGCVIINYFDGERVYALAEKLANYHFFKDIVIVDNSANEPETSKLTKLLSPLNKIHIINKGNQGYNRGTNSGFEYLDSVGCDYAFSINSDIDVSKETLESLVNVLEKNNEYAASGALMIEKGKFCNGFFPFPTIHSVVLENLGLAKKQNDEIHMDDKFVKVDVIRSSLCCFRFSAIKQVGFFDSNTFMYYGEAILASKLLKAGYFEGVLLNVKYYHNHHYSNKVLNIYRISHLDSLYAFKNYFGLSVFGKIRLNLSYYLGKILRILVGKK